MADVVFEESSSVSARDDTYTSVAHHDVGNTVVQHLTNGHLSTPNASEHAKSAATSAMTSRGLEIQQSHGSNHSASSISLEPTHTQPPLQHQPAPSIHTSENNDDELISAMKTVMAGADQTNRVDAHPTSLTAGISPDAFVNNSSAKEQQSNGSDGSRLLMSSGNPYRGRSHSTGLLIPASSSLSLRASDTTSNHSGQSRQESVNSINRNNLIDSLSLSNGPNSSRSLRSSQQQLSAAERLHIRLASNGLIEQKELSQSLTVPSALSPQSLANPTLPRSRSQSLSMSVTSDMHTYLQSQQTNNHAGPDGVAHSQPASPNINAQTPNSRRLKSRALAFAGLAPSKLNLRRPVYSKYASYQSSMTTTQHKWTSDRVKRNWSRIRDIIVVEDANSGDGRFNYAQPSALGTDTNDAPEIMINHDQLPYTFSVRQGFKYRASLRHRHQFLCVVHHMRVPVHYTDGSLGHEPDKDVVPVSIVGAGNASGGHGDQHGSHDVGGDDSHSSQNQSDDAEKMSESSMRVHTAIDASKSFNKINRGDNDDDDDGIDAAYDDPRSRNAGDGPGSTHANGGSSSRTFSIATIDRNFEFNVWDITRPTSLKPKTSSKLDHHVTQIVFISKHAMYAAVVNQKMIRFFTSKLDFTSSVAVPHPIQVIRYSARSNEIIAAGTHQITVWGLNAAHQKSQIRIFPTLRLTIDTGLSRNEWIDDIHLDEKNKLIWAVVDVDLLVFDQLTGHCIDTLHNVTSRKISCLAKHDAYQYTLVGSIDGTIKVINITHAVVHEFVSHTKGVTGIAVYPYGPLVLSCGLDFFVRMYNLKSFKEIISFHVRERPLYMNIIDDTQLYIQTRNTIELWATNQININLTTLNSAVMSIDSFHSVIGNDGNGARNSLPRRVVIRSGDGVIRVLNPVTGRTLTATLPLLETDSVQHVVYFPRIHRLFVMLGGHGEIWVFDTSRNPCTIADIWRREEMTAEDCSQIVVFEGVLGKWYENETDKVYAQEGVVSNRSPGAGASFAYLEGEKYGLLFGATTNGHLVVYGHGGTIVDRYQLHSGPIQHITCDHEQGLVVTLGKDEVIRISRVHPISENMLRVIISIKINFVPKLVCIMGSIICVASEDATLYMFEFNIERREWRVMPGHSKTDDHTDGIISIRCIPRLSLFISIGKDATLRVWNTKNALIREIQFQEQLDGLCVANHRGDLLVAIHNRVDVIRNSAYLPPNYIKAIETAMHTGTWTNDTVVSEQPLTFDDSLIPLTRPQHVHQKYREGYRYRIPHVDRTDPFNVFWHANLCNHLSHDTERHDPIDSAFFDDTLHQDAVTMNDVEQHHDSQDYPKHGGIDTSVNGMHIGVGLLNQPQEAIDAILDKLAQQHRQKTAMTAAAAGVQLTDLDHDKKDMFASGAFATLGGTGEKAADEATRVALPALTATAPVAVSAAVQVSSDAGQDASGALAVGQVPATANSATGTNTTTDQSPSTADASTDTNTAKQSSDESTAKTPSTQHLHHLMIAPDGFVPNSGIVEEVNSWLRLHDKQPLSNQATQSYRAAKAKKVEVDDDADRRLRSEQYKAKLKELMKNMPKEKEQEEEQQPEEPAEQPEIEDEDEIAAKLRLQRRMNANNQELVQQTLEVKLSPLIEKMMEFSWFPDDEIFYPANSGLEYDTHTIITNSKGQRMRKLRIDPTPDNLIPLLLRLILRSTPEVKAQITNYINWINEEFGFHDSTLLERQYCRHLQDSARKPLTGDEVSMYSNMIDSLLELNPNMNDVVPTLLMFMDSLYDRLRCKAIQALRSMGVNCIETNYLSDALKHVFEAAEEADVLGHSLPGAPVPMPMSPINSPTSPGLNASFGSQPRKPSTTKAQSNLRILMIEFLREQLRLYLIETAKDRELAKKLKGLTIYGLEEKQRTAERKERVAKQTKKKKASSPPRPSSAASGGGDKQSTSPAAAKSKGKRESVVEQGQPHRGRAGRSSTIGSKPQSAGRPTNIKTSPPMNIQVTDPSGMTRSETKGGLNNAELPVSERRRTVVFRDEGSGSNARPVSASTHAVEDGPRLEFQQVNGTAEGDVKAADASPEAVSAYVSKATQLEELVTAHRTKEYPTSLDPLFYPGIQLPKLDKNPDVRPPVVTLQDPSTTNFIDALNYYITMIELRNEREERERKEREYRESEAVERARRDAEARAKFLQFKAQKAAERQARDQARNARIAALRAAAQNKDSSLLPKVKVKLSDLRTGGVGLTHRSHCHESRETIDMRLQLFPPITPETSRYYHGFFAVHLKTYNKAMPLEQVNLKPFESLFDEEASEKNQETSGDNLGALESRLRVSSSHMHRPLSQMTIKSGPVTRMPSQQSQRTQIQHQKRRTIYSADATTSLRPLTVDAQIDPAGVATMTELEYIRGSTPQTVPRRTVSTTPSFKYTPLDDISQYNTEDENRVDDVHDGLRTLPSSASFKPGRRYFVPHLSLPTEPSKGN